LSNPAGKQKDPKTQT